MREAAVFDLDGTIFVRSTSERYFIKRLFLKGKIKVSSLLAYLLRTLKEMDYLSSKLYYKGMKLKELEEAAKKVFSHSNLLKHLSRDAIEEIEFHRGEGRLLVLLSGCPEFILNVINRFLNFDLAVGSVLEERDGIVTGELRRSPLGPEKATILKEIAQIHRINLDSSYGYGNSFRDIYFLELLGNPVAVNPDRKLLKYALKRGWKIAHWGYKF